MKRRRFLASAGAATTAGLLAGCLGSTDEENRLVVGTYSAFIDAPSISPGGWLKEQFESEFDASLVWQTPDAEVNFYVERANAGVDPNADVYLGLTVEDLVTIDGNAEVDLFTDPGDVEGTDDIDEGLDFDPDGRAIPFNTGYICLVYDSTATEAPDTFEGLTEPEYEGELIAQDPGQSTTGRSFLLHTIDHFGTDGYLDFWADLQDNGVRVLGSWGDAYGAWQGGEAPMVVSFSTDQVFAAEEGADLDEHQIRFLNGEAYANPEGMALFADADRPGLARQFMEFVLRPEIQGEIAQRNVVFPATTNAALPDDYAELAKIPETAVTFGYDELAGNLETWIDQWEEQFVSG